MRWLTKAGEHKHTMTLRGRK